MMSSLFRSAPEGYWPQSAMLEQMRATYDEVVLDDENAADNQLFFRVTLNGLTFLAVLIHAPSHKDKIIGFGFLTIFAGFEVSDSGLDALNRNLHLSVAEFDDERNLLLFAFLEPKGAFDANRFSLILQAWHRDIVMTIKMIVPGASFAGTLSSKAVSLARRFSNNNQLPSDRAEPAAGLSINLSREPSADGTATRERPVFPQSTPPRDVQSMIARFVGLSDASRSLCDSCEGRGHIGFPRRSCKTCEGSGLITPNR